MATWYELNLVFYKVGDLDGLLDVLDRADSDAPTDSITQVGTLRRKVPTIPGPVSWRNPLLSLETLIHWLEDFGFEGHGWMFEEDGEKLNPDSMDRFTFSPTKAKWEVSGNSASNGETAIRYESGRIILSGPVDLEIPVQVILSLTSRL